MRLIGAEATSPIDNLSFTKLARLRPATAPNINYMGGGDLIEAVESGIFVSGLG